MDLASQVGPWGLALLVIGSVVTALVRGWLIPRSTHLEIVALMNRTIVDREAQVAELKTQVAILVGSRVREPTQ